MPMKDGLSRDVIGNIASTFERVHSPLDGSRFVGDACEGLDDLELKDRVVRVAAVLREHLPDPYPSALAVIREAASVWPARDPNDALGGFAAWPMIDFVGIYGLDHPEVSLDALAEITHLFSAEFAIRPFLVHHTDMTLRRLHEWTADEREHVRRLVSEGTRPLLPWGIRLKAFQADPAPGLALLERLKDDPSDYVRRSVANHLNDVSKDHPDLVVDICTRWRKGASPERDWIVRHATRTLVKKGHPAALKLLGFDDNPKVRLRDLQVTPEKIRVGDSIDVAFRLESTGKAAQDLVVDYAVHHRKANGEATPKVFKLKTLHLGPGEAVSLSKRHSFRRITTRQYYPGRHEVEVTVNGKRVGRAGCDLTVWNKGALPCEGY